MCIMNIICYNATSTACNSHIMRSLISHENLKFHLQFTSTVTYDSKVTEKGSFWCVRCAQVKIIKKTESKERVGEYMCVMNTQSMV